MGWGYCGTDDQGREIGYEIDATCDEPGCDAEINRGLDYVCGGMHGGGDHGYGCGKYFCHKHLKVQDVGKETHAFCRKCYYAMPERESNDD